MSSFYCPECGKPIIDTPKGYISECKHYNINKAKKRATGYADTLMAIFGYKRVKIKTKKK